MNNDTCKRFSLEPELHSVYGDSAAILKRLADSPLSIEERRAIGFLVEANSQAELSFLERNEKAATVKLEWRTVGKPREKLHNEATRNRGTDCIGEQMHQIMSAEWAPTFGPTRTPTSAPASAISAVRHTLGGLAEDDYASLVAIMCC